MGLVSTHTFGNRGAGHFCIGENDHNYSNEEIVIAASSGALVAGTVLGEVTASPGTYAPLDPAASDGTEVAAGILWDDRADSTSTQKAAAVVRHQTVKGHALNYENALSAPQLAQALTELEAIGIIVRD